MAKSSYIRESHLEIVREIKGKVQSDPEVKLRCKKFAIEVRDHWRNIEAPILTGEYAGSVHTEKRLDRNKLPHWWVGTRIWYAHFIEYGTGPDSKGGFRYIARLGRSVGENTPTPEFAPAARTAHYFGGTPGGDVTDVA